MDYKYNENLCQRILRILYYNSSELCFNTLHKLVNFSNKSDRPTERKYSKNLKILEEWELIKRRKDKTKGGMKKTWLSLTERGKLCLINDYKPDEYRKLYRVISIIFFKAFQGVWIDEKGNDVLSLSRKSPPQHYTMIQGITQDDIFNFKNRISADHMDIKKIDITPEEMKNYFKYLENKKILEKIFEDGQIRYQVSDKYKPFVIWSNNILVNLISQKLEIKWKFISGPKSDPEEKKWHSYMHGKRDTDNYLRDCYGIRKKNKNIDKSIKDRKWKEIISFNMEIEKTLKDIREKYQDQLKEIPGFVDVILSFICPIELLKVMENENKKYS